MRITIQHTSKIVSAAWLFIFILSGCGQTELEGLLPASDDSSTGEPVELRISLADSPEYNNETTSTPATRSGEPLIGEWVKVNSFSATRSAEEYEGPAIAAMELFEDSVSSAPQTRTNMADGYYFRLIAFEKVGDNYEYQSAADYTANGTSAPTLKKGKMILLKGQTYRFVAYSFNNNSPMGDLPSSYTWGSDAITIPDLSNDFMTFDSKDIKASGETFALRVNFTHQLCKLSVKINVAGFGSNNTFTNCTGVYIKQGGNSSSWIVGSSAITADTHDTALFDIPNNNSSTTTRLVPFASASTITVHFGTLSVGGKNADNSDITSSQSVQLKAGRSYTITVQFQKRIGIQVPSTEINLIENGCTGQDKIDLSKLTWALGNLKSTSGVGSKNYVWTTTTDYGYYYTWRSAYTGTTGFTNSDPCEELDPDKYGIGWRTPSSSEFGKLARCTNKELINSGMWFMNKGNGLFLPAAGYKFSSATAGDHKVGEKGFYWCFDRRTNSDGYVFVLIAGSAYVSSGDSSNGYSVRCVKGPM